MLVGRHDLFGGDRISDWDGVDDRVSDEQLLVDEQTVKALCGS
jgi:hypothetical protein